jgi:sulfur carrier protein
VPLKKRKIKMLKIQLNGESYQMLEGAETLLELVQTLDLENKRFAVEVNEEIVTRSEYKTHYLKNKDQVEIVQAIGGG